jgi:hypothetical protein
MNHSDVVAAQKKVCEDLGLDLTGPNCFEITKRVAWALRSENAGLLDKPGGNNKDGYAVDIICYPITMEVPGNGNPPPTNNDLQTRMTVALESIADILKQLAAKVL